MAETVRVFDTTLRDGEQAPGFSMTPAEKLRLARQLEALGVDVIEAGFPMASEGDFAGVEAVARACRTVQVAALARALEADVRRAALALAAASKPRLHVFVATSEIHLKHKLRKTRAEVLADTFKAVALARSLVADVEFSAEDATRSDREFLASVLEAAVAAGATTLNIPDTVGYSVPSEYANLIGYLRAHVRGTRAADGVTWSVHCHNDLGLAVANSLAAVGAGARQVECTINGIGERAGNAALEEVAMALHVRRDSLPYATGLALEQLHPTSQLLTEITGVTVQPNKAIVGANAFAHEAGIHQDGMLKSPMTYEIMTPRTVGRAGHELVLGKHSGRHALQARLTELGFALDREQLQRAYVDFLAAVDERKAVTERELRAIARRSGAAPAFAPAACPGDSTESLWAV
ncbi:MAG TPA: 2-isopropylmalate synthase [Terriglobales bacterium]|nr:2-isopropylmalate synthase [Terriglobales bacterium]